MVFSSGRLCCRLCCGRGRNVGRTVVQYETGLPSGLCCNPLCCGRRRNLGRTVVHYETGLRSNLLNGLSFVVQKRYSWVGGGGFAPEQSETDWTRAVVGGGDMENGGGATVQTMGTWTVVVGEQAAVHESDRVGAGMHDRVGTGMHDRAGTGVLHTFPTIFVCFG